MVVEFNVNRVLAHSFLCDLRGRGGVNEMEATVKGAKGGEAQSWHCAGNKLVLGEGGIPCLAVPVYQSRGGHSSMTPELPVLC